MFQEETKIESIELSNSGTMQSLTNLHVCDALASDIISKY